MFKAVLATGTFDGRTTKEEDAGGGTSNCVTTGITVPTIVSFFAAIKLSGETWTIAGPAGSSGNDGSGYNSYIDNYAGVTNTYGDDGIVYPKKSDPVDCSTQSKWV